MNRLTMLFVSSLCVMTACGGGGGGGSLKGIVIREKKPDDVKKIFFGHQSSSFGKAVAFRRTKTDTGIDEMVIFYFGKVIRHDGTAKVRMSSDDLKNQFETNIGNTSCSSTRSSSNIPTSLNDLQTQLDTKGYVPGIPGCIFSKGPFTFICDEWSYFQVTEATKKIGRASVFPLNEPPPKVNVSLRRLSVGAFPKGRLRERVLMPCRGARFPIIRENMSFVMVEATDLHGLCPVRKSKQVSPPFDAFLMQNSEINNLLQDGEDTRKRLQGSLRYPAEQLSNDTRIALRQEPFTLRAFFSQKGIWASEPAFVDFHTEHGILSATSAFSQFTPKSVADRPLDISQLNFPKLHMFHPRAKNFFRNNVWDPKYDRLLIDPSKRQESIHPSTWMSQLNKGPEDIDLLQLCENIYLKTTFINLDERSLPPTTQISDAPPAP